MSKSFNVPRGMKDIEPEEMSKRLWLERKILDILNRYGFQAIEPTPIENLETLEAKSGPQIKEEIYWFKDKSDRDLGLRFDLTVGMARMIANRFDLPEPTKLCSIADVFRYDEPQFGRYRHIYQWDAEIFGTSDPLADAESICVGIDILKEVGLKDFEVRISSRKLVEPFLRNVGIETESTLEKALIIIDKLSKIGKEKMSQQLGEIGLSEKMIAEIQWFCLLKGPPQKTLSELSSRVGNRAELQPGISELERLIDILQSFRRLDHCVYDLSVVRGIGYYDGIVFEAFDRSVEGLGSIFGGGRYDGLCSIYGKRNVPATGVAGGIERLMLSLERGALYPELKNTPKVFVAGVNAEVQQNVWETVASLRSDNIWTDFDLKGRSLQSQLQYADSMRIPYAIIVGPREIKQNMVTLREMINRKEQQLSLTDAINQLRA
ncbi:MAG: histidine--tRNA ligase [archaeon]